jgi:hypothetical protein
MHGFMDNASSFAQYSSERNDGNDNDSLEADIGDSTFEVLF